MRCSLSLREIVAARSARVRGNETQPTETAGRISQAQLERLAESELATTSSEKPVDGRRARGRKRSGVSIVPSPSPRPLPHRSGRIARRAFANPERLDSSPRGMRCSLSLREIVAARSARVRGNGAQPTETAGRISQAQLERLAESELATRSSEKPVDGRSARAR